MEKCSMPYMTQRENNNFPLKIVLFSLLAFFNKGQPYNEVSTIKTQGRKDNGQFLNVYHENRSVFQCQSYNIGERDVRNKNNILIPLSQYKDFKMQVSLNRSLKPYEVGQPFKQPPEYITYNKQNNQTKMSTEGLFDQSPNLFLQKQNLKMQIEQEQFSIEQFLNLEPFENSYQENKISDPLVKQEFIVHSSNDVANPSSHETEPTRKKKSIFHNFQKHLITLLKNHIKIKTRTFEEFDNKKVAYSLWQAFLKTTSSNKKMLHIIFGFPDSISTEEELDTLALQMPEFKIIRDKKTSEEILIAQEMIRHEVIHQAEHLDKAYLELHCSVSRLDLFYEYFKSFIQEIKEGPMTKRLTKKQKGSLVNKIKGSIVS